MWPRADRGHCPLPYRGRSRLMLSDPITEQLLTAGLNPAGIEQIVQTALDEDLRYGPDVTSAATAPAGATAVAAGVARRPGGVAGRLVALASRARAVREY